MKIHFYTMSDGDPWGFWCEGHLSQTEVVSAFNEALEQQDFKPIESDQIQHKFGARVARSDGEDDDFNFYIVAESAKGAIPITYVDAEALERSW
ncbi:hypothetical protein [Enterovibrio paralichthyis]|uniref:hypothetical protein n=1 Tax=Enterovibrio paralichthyis TaxID=2853805 RepID=UPI001C450E59|nr:hypothetical protein [Enterovibrio paralichthyis]MBV7300237.1 hypothetical protein [Enterovibrio paralichthyis]